MAISLIVMADYQASPLWRPGADGHAETSISLDLLPLSEELRAELQAWCTSYEAYMDAGVATYEHERLTMTGHELARRVSEELGTGYDVTYQDGSSS